MAAPPRSPAARKRRRRIMILVCVAAVLVFQEALLRFVFPIPEITRFNRSQYANLDPANTRARQYERIEVCSDPDKHAAVMNLGEYGFRTPAFDRDPDGPRVIFFGDSYTEGFMVDEGESFVDRIRASLDGRAEVINLGLTGANVPNYWKLMGDAVPLLRPTHVVLVLHTNDFYLTALPPFEVGAPANVPPIVWLPRAAELVRMSVRGTAMRTWLRWPTSSYFAAVPSPLNPLSFAEADRAIAPAIVEAAKQGRFNPTPVLAPFSGHRTLTVNEQEATRVGRALLDVVNLCREVGATMVLGYIPTNINVSTRYNKPQKELGLQQHWVDSTSFSSIQESLVLIGRELGVRVLDFTPALRAAESAGRGCYFEYDGHLRPEGHALLAEVLQKELFTDLDWTKAAATSGGSGGPGIGQLPAASRPQPDAKATSRPNAEG